MTPGAAPVPNPPGPGGADAGLTAVILLAAGQSRRMRGADKLLAPVRTKPLLAHAALTAVHSYADTVYVVLPPAKSTYKRLLAPMPVSLIEAPDCLEGMGASLRNAMAHIGPQIEAVIIALADMPDITPAHYNALIKAYNPEAGREICRATTEDGHPGHPVLFGRRFFAALATARGDRGARAVIDANARYLSAVPTPGAAACVDLDTPEAVATWQAAQGKSGTS